MHAEDLVVDKCGNWHAVEHILELFPDADAVSALALIVEAIHSIDLATLVVASQEEEVLLILDLVGQEKDDSLQGLLATVDIVTQEQVVGLWWETSIFEQSQQIWELSMCVTYPTRTSDQNQSNE